MFRARSIEEPTRIPVTAAFVLATLFMALALSITALFQVYYEYRLLGDWLERPGPVPIDGVRALRQDIGARIIARSVASALLVLCTLLTLWLLQRQLLVRRALHQVKVLAYNILASLNQGVITTDRESTITSINSAALALLGIDSECVDRPISVVSSPEVPLEDLSRCVTEHEQAVSDREFSLDLGGRVRRLVASALELKDDRGATIGSVIHLRDVTERMLLKEQMWRMEQIASLNSLASGLHHEIKNPLTALSIHIQLLEERLRNEGAPGPVSELFGVLKAEIGRLNGTLESFRNFACLERINRRPVEVRTVLADLVRLIGPQASQRGVSLELLADDRPCPPVSLDAEKLKQAVLNLLLNALDAMPQGGVLGLRSSREGGWLRIVVRDTGPGIPPEIRDHVFHPYFSTKDHGTGIGLSLAEKLVRQHQGHLDFRTGPEGTSFVISLPLDERHEGGTVP